VIEDIVEELFALIDVILDGLEDALLLLKFPVQLLLPLVVEVKLTNRRLLQLVKLAQRINLVLSRLWHLLLLLFFFIVVVSFVVSWLSLLDSKLFFGYRVLRMLMYQILVVDLINFLLLVPDLLPLLLLLNR